VEETMETNGALEKTNSNQAVLRFGILSSTKIESYVFDKSVYSSE